MKTTFDLNTLMFSLLKEKQISITGGVYTDERPDDSNAEDIVINTIELSQEYYPQIGTSNVNIHVSDLDVKIGGKIQKKADLKRLEVLTKEVLSIVRNAKITGLKCVIEGQNLLKDQEVAAQHYSNIRISWVIHE